MGVVGRQRLQNAGRRHPVGRVRLRAGPLRRAERSLGAIEAGMERVSPNLDAAARTLGATPLATMGRVHLPLLLPALGSAALLVFVDAMKELPTALLLRPFNFETLATHVYSLASLELFESAGIGALAIVIVGLLPVLALHQTIASGRTGQRFRPLPLRSMGPIG